MNSAHTRQSGPDPDSGFQVKALQTLSRRSLLAGQLFWGGQLLHRNVQRFRGGIVSQAQRRLYHSTLGLKVIKKKKKVLGRAPNSSSFL